MSKSSKRFSGSIAPISLGALDPVTNFSDIKLRRGGEVTLVLGLGRAGGGGEFPLTTTENNPVGKIFVSVSHEGGAALDWNRPEIGASEPGLVFELVGTDGIFKKSFYLEKLPGNWARFEIELSADYGSDQIKLAWTS